MTSASIPRVVVSGVITDEAGRYLLVRRRDDGLWCCPGGHVDFQESVVTALHREIEEESGVAVEVGALVGIYSVYGPRAPSPAKHFVALSFRCRYLHGTPRPGSDELEVRFFAYPELPALRSNHRRRIDDARADRPGPIVE